MKLRTLRVVEVRELVMEMRSFAALPPGPNPQALARAKEIWFLLQGQAWASEWMKGKVQEAWRSLQILLSARRWRSVTSIDFVRAEVKGPCSRVMAALQQKSGARRSA